MIKFQSSRTSEVNIIISDNLRNLEGSSRGSTNEVIIPLYILSTSINISIDAYLSMYLSAYLGG